jgi:hypothetical protein
LKTRNKKLEKSPPKPGKNLARTWQEPGKNLATNKKPLTILFVSG